LNEGHVGVRSRRRKGMRRGREGGREEVGGWWAGKRLELSVVLALVWHVLTSAAAAAAAAADKGPRWH